MFRKKRRGLSHILYLGENYCKIGIYQNVTVDITTKVWYSNSMSCNNEYYIKTGIYKDIRGGEREHMKI